MNAWKLMNGPNMNNDWKWWKKEWKHTKNMNEICKAKLNEELTILIEYNRLQWSNREDKREVGIGIMYKNEVGKVRLLLTILEPLYRPKRKINSTRYLLIR